MSLKKPLLLSIASGCLLSMPWMWPSGSWIILLAFIPLLAVEDMLTRSSTAQPGYLLFFCSLVTFLTWNILSTWWIAYVSLSGMLIIALINAFLMACIWWLMHAIHRRLGADTAYFTLVVFWLSFETMHFYWTIQWPWLTLGNAFASMPWLIQWYELTGVLGGSLWILVVNILLYSAIKSRSSIRPAVNLHPAVWLLVILALPAGWSVYRYQTYTEKGPVVEVAVLQPNVNPYADKFSGMSTEVQTQRLASLARSVISPSTSYVVTPETALAPMWENDSLRQNKALMPLDSVLVTYPHTAMVAGAITQRYLKQDEAPDYTARADDEDGFYQVYNTALFFNHTPEVQLGHKSILVSGVEKMPFQEYFSFLGNYVVEAGGISGSLASATGPTVFKGTKGEGIGSVICFESAFAPYVALTVKNGASVLFIITNDGWWKESQGITQHFGYARIRAIETRRSIARSANTGISGFIGQRGEIIQKTSVNTAAAISAPLHLNNQLTFFVRHGNLLGRSSALMSLILLLYFLIKRI
ncbi:MAG: apolipoprotein N-acyltransferase [Verrucomicrobia bacterium]|nr:apolipoprotein N-acyltransferase [Prolixibacteraceae bacterium]